MLANCSCGAGASPAKRVAAKTTPSVSPETNHPRHEAGATRPALSSELRRYFRAIHRSSRPRHLTREDAAKVSRYRLRHLIHIKFPSQFFLHGGHRLRRNSAGHDQIEVAEIRIHIQSEAMRRHRSGDMHTDGGDLGCRLRLSPNAREPGNAFGCDAEIAARANENLLEPPNIVDSTKRLAPGWE